MTDKHEILLVHEVADRLRMSICTVNRLLRKRRNGEGNFPLPLYGKKCTGRWLASDIGKYIESLADVNKSQETPDYQKRKETVRAELRQHGIDRKS